MAKGKNKSKMFLRITISKNKKAELVNKADEMDMGVTSYIKMKLFGEKNG